MKTKKPTSQRTSQKILAFVGSRPFFALVILVFVVQAAWLAVSARYPMAFDEGFHLGIIRVYAKQISPILTEQPAGMAPYGALTTDPSYLFHYFMSFPYRWLSGVIGNELTVIMWLRLMNVAMITVGLVLFRKVLLKTKASAPVVHTALLFFSLVPVVPLLAAHVNYDNLLMLIVPANILLVLRFKEQLDKNKQCNLALLLVTLSVGLLGSLVKFAYLPILTGVMLYALFVLWQFGRKHRLLRSWQKPWFTMPYARQAAVVALCAVSVGLFLQRYAVNVVYYHNLVPQCGQVVGVERCQAYGPWARNYRFAQTKTEATGNPVVFLGGWFSGMFLRSFFTINGPGNPAHYDNRPPLPLISAAAIVTFCAGLYLVLRHRRWVVDDDLALLCMLLVVVIYVLSVMGRNYHDYRQLGQMVAINGRYLVLIMLPVMVMIGKAYTRVLQPRHQVALLTVVFLLFLQGGGVLSYIHSSNRHWYRQDTPAIVDANLRMRGLLRPVILRWPDDHIPFTPR